MSVATEPQPRSIPAWAALKHSKPTKGSCSSESNSTSSSSVMPASTSSSGKSSGKSSGRSLGKSSGNPAPSPAIQAVSSTTWTAGTFSFPPCSSRTLRSLPIPSQKCTPTASPSTSRVINALPGFDEFAELVVASETTAPRLTVTPSSGRASPARTPTSSRSRHFRLHGQRSAPSEPKSAVSSPPTPTVSLPWVRNEDDDGRITFIFGRLKPARVRYTAPPSQILSLPPEPSTTTTIFSRNPSPGPSSTCELPESRPATLS